MIDIVDIRMPAYKYNERSTSGEVFRRRVRSLHATSVINLKNTISNIVDWLLNACYNTYMHKDPNSYSMSLTVPHSVYGACTYFIPESMKAWLYQHGLERYSYCGGNLWGNGYTNGVTNADSVYMVYNIQPEDATAFGIQFPRVKIYLGVPCDHTETDNARVG